MVLHDAAGQRLDVFLAAGAADLSRSRLKALIEAGHVAIGERTVTDPAYRVKPDEAVVLSVPPPVDATPKAQAIPLAIVFEDEYLIVVDKPPGLVVHPAPGNPDRTLVNALLAHCGDSLLGIGGERRPGIVHRLDKDTSGLLVAAKTELAHRGLAELFAAHDIERAYRAIVWGKPRPGAGTVDGAIGRDPRNRKRMAIVSRNGKPARTHYRTLQDLAVAALVECRLETGRTHQIRVHMSSIGCPVVGDPLYGRPPRRLKPALPTEATDFPRQALHAGKLGFRHPITQQALIFETPPPQDFMTLLQSLETIETERIPD
ncbi:MAG: RluA family pseudouridine synthase [Alphaproteobacteria bacterium]